MKAPVASASRTMARVATRSSKGLINDSMAFHPSAASQRMPAAAKQTSDSSFAFYHSNGASARISKAQSQSPPRFEEQPICKYSAEELDQIFAKSRLHATNHTSSPKTTIPKDSFAFYPAKQQQIHGGTVNTATKEPFFGFYPSQGVVQRSTREVQPKASAQQQQQQQAKAKADNTSILAMGSVMMGFLGVQARRSMARA